MLVFELEFVYGVCQHVKAILPQTPSLLDVYVGVLSLSASTGGHLNVFFLFPETKAICCANKMYVVCHEMMSIDR